MRELPVILECAKDVEELCPEAWVINYINPTTVNGIALKKYAPKLKSFALCDGLHMPHVKKAYAVRAGIIDDIKDYNEETDKAFDFKMAGVNHFTWLIKADYNGKDLSPEIGEYIYKQASLETVGGDTGAKAIYNEAIGYELYKIFGYVPTNVGHTKEYVRYWQGRNIAPQDIPQLNLWETEERYKRHKDMMEQVDGFLNGKIPITEYMGTFIPDHATDIIECMVGDLGKEYYVNTYNNGAVTNMRDDAFLELPCIVDKNGPKPIKIGEMPTGIRAMQELVLETHELTADAVTKGSLPLLRRAMMIDPLANSISDSDAIIKDLLEAEKDIIPAIWY